MDGLEINLPENLSEKEVVYSYLLCKTQDEDELRRFLAQFNSVRNSGQNVTAELHESEAGLVIKATRDWAPFIWQAIANAGVAEPISNVGDDCEK